MSGLDMMMDSALKLLIAKLPPEVMGHIATLAQTGVGLKAQLDRLEAEIVELKNGQRELIQLFASLVNQLQPEKRDVRSEQHPPA